MLGARFQIKLSSTTTDSEIKGCTKAVVIICIVSISSYPTGNHYIHGSVGLKTFNISLNKQLVSGGYAQVLAGCMRGVLVESASPNVDPGDASG